MSGALHQAATDYLKVRRALGCCRSFKVSVAASSLVSACVT
jgi:hypothetical protein